MENTIEPITSPVLPVAIAAKLKITPKTLIVTWFTQNLNIYLEYFTYKLKNFFIVSTMQESRNSRPAPSFFKFSLISLPFYNFTFQNTYFQ